MRRRMRAAVCVAALGVSLAGGGVALCGVARADAPQWLPPPAMYPPDTWKGRAVAVVRILDKLDAHVQVFDIPAGQDATYKSLTLHARACLERPPTLPADTAAWLAVRDAHEGMTPFDGWMLRQEPALGVFQNPLYDVQVVGCGGADVAPIPPPLAVVQQQATPPVTPATDSAPAAGPAAPQQGGSTLPPLPPMPPPQAARPMPAPPPPGDEGAAAAPLLLH